MGKKKRLKLAIEELIKQNAELTKEIEFLQSKIEIINSPIPYERTMTNRLEIISLLLHSTKPSYEIDGIINDVEKLYRYCNEIHNDEKTTHY